MKTFVLFPLAVFALFGLYVIVDKSPELQRVCRWGLAIFIIIGMMIVISDIPYILRGGAHR